MNPSKAQISLFSGVPPKESVTQFIPQIFSQETIREACFRFSKRQSSLVERKILLDTIREEWQRARIIIAQLFEEDGQGVICAQRLSLVQDLLLEALFVYLGPFLETSLEEHRGEERDSGFALLAVGGYGRGMLAPSSDLDLLFLHRSPLLSQQSKRIQELLYLLWDLGFKLGHATRDLETCLALAKKDGTIRTSLLEARFLVGDDSLSATLQKAFDAEVIAGTQAAFIQEKLAERDARHARQGFARCLLEPDVKESKGGLRDLHTLFWIVQYCRRAESFLHGSAGKVDFFSQSEQKLFDKCHNFLWRVRCHIHFLTGRAEDRLSFALQREVAQKLGYVAHPGMQSVERFMKHYFLVTKDVGDLTGIVCAALEDQHLKETPHLSRLLKSPPLLPETYKAAAEQGFLIERGRLKILRPTLLKEEPRSFLRIFHFAEVYNISFHPETLRLMRRSLSLIKRELRGDPEANALFLSILTGRRDPEAALARMNDVGVLGRFIPEFGRIVGMMQFNMYHHYTVDTHLLHAVGVLSALEQGRLAIEHPLSTQLIDSLIPYRRALAVAVFLHDIAKGRPEDHAVAGARIARGLCVRFGLTPAETETVTWLIRHHLLMSKTAQSRDLTDPRTIRDFAKIVQTPTRLKLLLILTVADIKAVGPGVFTGWKGQLLRSLYFETEKILIGEQPSIMDSESLQRAWGRFRSILRESVLTLPETQFWSEDRLEAYIESHSPSYWTRVPLKEQLAHAGLFYSLSTGDKRFAKRIILHRFEDVTEISIFTPNMPDLLCRAAGASFLAGGDIVDAHIHTTRKDLALGSIFIARKFSQDEDEMRRAEKIAQLIENTLTEAQDISEMVARRKRPRSPRMRAFAIAPQILLHNALSDHVTVLEISGLDRAGLLYDLTEVIHRHGLFVASAHIGTFGERAIDVFYITDREGKQITEESLQKRLKESLRVVLLSPEPGSA